MLICIVIPFFRSFRFSPSLTHSLIFYLCVFSLTQTPYISQYILFAFGRYGIGFWQFYRKTIHSLTHSRTNSHSVVHHSLIPKFACQMLCIFIYFFSSLLCLFISISLHCLWFLIIHSKSGVIRHCSVFFAGYVWVWVSVWYTVSYACKWSVSGKLNTHTLKKMQSRTFHTMYDDARTTHEQFNMLLLCVHIVAFLIAICPCDALSLSHHRNLAKSIGVWH